MATAARPHLYVLAEFGSPGQIERALPRICERNWGEIETHTPYPIHGASACLKYPRSPIPFIVLCTGLAGVSGALLMEWWCNAVDYPINVGGRPLFSLPSWIPIMFELMVLFGSFGAFFGLWALARLPQPYHTVFRSERFRNATVDRFWVRIEPAPDTDLDAIRTALREMGASHVDVVEDVA